MFATSITPQINLTPSNLELKSNSGPTRADAAEQMEGLFLSQLLKQMRTSQDGEGLFPGDSSDSYGSMFDMFLGKHLAENGGIGIADSMGKESQIIHNSSSASVKA